MNDETYEFAKKYEFILRVRKLKDMKNIPCLMESYISLQGGILGLNCGSLITNLPLALELLPYAARIGFTFRCSKGLIRFGIFRSGDLVF